MQSLLSCSSFRCISLCAFFSYSILRFLAFQNVTSRRFFITAPFGIVPHSVAFYISDPVPSLCIVNISVSPAIRSVPAAVFYIGPPRALGEAWWGATTRLELLAVLGPNCIGDPSGEKALPVFSKIDLFMLFLLPNAEPTTPVAVFIR